MDAGVAVGEGPAARGGPSGEMTMPQTLMQRMTLVLPLVGVAFLLASMALPLQVAVFAWTIAMVSFLTALIAAIVAQRERRSQQ